MFKIRGFFIVVSIALIILSSSISYAKYSGGSGTADDPYQIGSATDLLALATNIGDYGANFILTADIDLSSSGTFTTAVIARDTDNTNDNFDGTAFTGIFDGAGHKIINLTINTNGVPNRYLGLFGSIGGEIKNLGLENVSITGGDYSYNIGGLVGENDSNISNCYSTGTVSGGSGSDSVGGLAGYNTYGSISNCYSTVAVTGGDKSEDLGGLVGSNGGNYCDSSISNCYSTGAVTGGKYLGGLVGGNWNGSIDNCYSTGTVTGGDYSLDLGGLVGYNYGYGVSINDCHATGAVTGGSDSKNLGGLVGEHEDSGDIGNCYSTGAVTGGDASGEIGGLVGQNSGLGDINNCYSTGAVSGGDDSDSLGGLVGDSGKYYGYSGSICNCYSTSTVTGDVNSSSLGGLVGGNDSNTSNCYSTGAVTGGDGSETLGGLLGWSDGNISNCYSTGAVTGGDESKTLGGLVGDNWDNGSIGNCYSTGTVTGGLNSWYLGGLVGESDWNNSSISNCYSIGVVYGGDGSWQLGGLVGFNEWVTISNCYFLVTSGPDNGYGEPLTDGQMKHQSSFVGWDFENVWDIVEGATYPYLKGELPMVATPTINPNGGTFTSSVKVTLACSTAGTTIRYTTDGSDPTSSSTAYSSSITLTSSAMVKAKAFKNGYNTSATAAASFIFVLPTAATPTIKPNGGTFTKSVKVKLACGTAGATIRYTIEGSDPTSGSTIYSSPITLNDSATVKAKAFKSGYNASATATASFILPTMQTGTLKVTISPQGAIYAGAQWRRAGTTIWHNSNDIENNISVGLYKIEFKNVTGWGTPANKSVKIGNGQTTNASGIYNGAFFFSQLDKNWKGKQLDHCPITITIGNTGCALTSTAMVLKYYGVDTDPNRLNDYLIVQSGFDSDGDLIWENVPEVSSGKVVWIERIDTSDWNRIDSELGQGYPIIAKVNSTKVAEHFIVIWGKKGNDYDFYDPADKTKLIRKWPKGHWGKYTLLGLRIYHSSG